MAGRQRVLQSHYFGRHELSFRLIKRPRAMLIVAYNYGYRGYPCIASLVAAFVRHELAVARSSCVVSCIIWSLREMVVSPDS